MGNKTLKKKIDYIIKCLKERRYKEAELESEIVIAEYKEDIQGYVFLTGSYIKQNKFLEARKIIDQIINKFDKNTEGYLLLANLYYREEKFIEAEEEIKKILENVNLKKRIEVYIMLGYIYIGKNELEKAEKEAKKIIEFYADIRGWILLDNVYSAKGEYVLSREEIDYIKQNSLLQTDKKIWGYFLLRLIVNEDSYEEYIDNIVEEKLFIYTSVFERLRKILLSKSTKKDNIIKYLNAKLEDKNSVLSVLKEEFSKREKIDFKNKIFYKYHEISANTLGSLIREGIYKSDTQTFNDPFDPYLKKYEDDIKIIKILKEIKISCLTDSKDNFLMWSHYGNNHKGVCLGYRLKDIGNNTYFDKVEYKRIDTLKYKNIDGFIKEKIMEFMVEEDMLLTDIFFRKTEKWKYENEYRLIHVLTEGNFYKNIELVEVIFGIDTSDSDKKTIFELLKKLKKHEDFEKIKFYKTRQKEGLDIENVPLLPEELENLD